MSFFFLIASLARSPRKSILVSLGFQIDLLLKHGRGSTLVPTSTTTSRIIFKPTAFLVVVNMLSKYNALEEETAIGAIEFTSP